MNKTTNFHHGVTDRPREKRSNIGKREATLAVGLSSPQRWVIDQPLSTVAAPRQVCRITEVNKSESALVFCSNGYLQLISNPSDDPSKERTISLSLLDINTYSLTTEHLKIVCPMKFFACDLTTHPKTDKNLITELYSEIINEQQTEFQRVCECFDTIRDLQRLGVKCNSVWQINYFGKNVLLPKTIEPKEFDTWKMYRETVLCCVWFCSNGGEDIESIGALDVKMEVEGQPVKGMILKSSRMNEGTTDPEKVLFDLRMLDKWCAYINQPQSGRKYRKFFVLDCGKPYEMSENYKYHYDCLFADLDFVTPATKLFELCTNLSEPTMALDENPFTSFMRRITEYVTQLG